MNLSFAAIDFETATGYMESACAVGIVTCLLYTSDAADE